MSDTAIKIPGAGYRSVVKPCPECMILVERSSEVTPFPGQHFDCYACMNRFTVVRTERGDGAAYDRYSTGAAYDEKVNGWKLQGVVFNKARLGESYARNWLVKNQLDGYELLTDIGAEFLEFSKNDVSSADADVYVRLADGIFGRVVQDMQAI
jgi:hypothetical protein